MHRAKVIKRVQLPLGNDVEVFSNIFNQITGTGAADMQIVYPRYARIKEICVKLVKVFTTLAESPFMRENREFAAQRDQILAFCASTSEAIHVVFSADLSEYVWNLCLVPKEIREQFSKIYTDMKQSAVVRTFILVCDGLVSHKKNFIDARALNHLFVINMPGVEWCPFPFTNLDYKKIMSLDYVGANTIEFFMLILHKSYELSRALYDEIESPDFDVDAMVDMIMAKIKLLQKIPQISRCGNAFKKIEDSVSMLRENFTTYYHDFIKTTDSTIIMQHFITDVSKNTQLDAVTMLQFQKIIKYYRDAVKVQKMPQQAKDIFDKISASYDHMANSFKHLNTDIDGDGDGDNDDNRDDNSDNTSNDNTSSGDKYSIPAGVAMTAQEYDALNCANVATHELGIVCAQCGTNGIYDSNS